MVRKSIFLAGLFILILALIAYGANTANKITLELTSNESDENAVIEGDIVINISSNLDPNLVLSGEMGDVNVKKRLLDVLDEEEISYGFSEGSLVPGQAQSSKSMVFIGSGKQYFYFKFPKGSDIIDIDMKINGLKHESVYPKFPSIDIGDNNAEEWKYFGSPSGYGNYTLPAGLDESKESGNSFLLNKQEYFCEIINVGQGKDFEVSAKYDYGKDQGGANISAIIFSYTGSGNSITAQGGADRCDLPEPSSGGSTYRSCNIKTGKFISGSYLVCAYNNNFGDGKKQQYKLSVDNSGSTSYTCGALSSGSAACQKQSVGDFFIKVKSANYSGELKKTEGFKSWGTSYIAENELKNYLSNCDSYDGTSCLVPVAVKSSEGVVDIDNIKVIYKSGGSQFEENSVYDVVGAPFLVDEIEGMNLTDGYELTISLENLYILAPSVSSDKNYTLKVKLEPGPEATRTIKVLNYYVVNASGADAKKAVKAYKDILDEIKSKNFAVFEILGKKTEIDDAASKLSQILNDITSIENSNLSDSNKTDKKNKKLAEAKGLVNSLPQTAILASTVSDTVAAGYSDIVDAVLLQNQRSEDARKKIFEIQRSSTISADAEFYRVTNFDDSTKGYTLVTKKVSTGVGSGYLVELIPSSVAASASQVNFKANPEVVSNAGPIIARWSISSLNGAEISYVLEGDQTVALPLLQSFVIPSQLPSKTGGGGSIGAKCGDDICSFIEVDGERIPLEDEYTCPQDCAKKRPYGFLIIAIVIIAIIIYYINFYKGKYSFSELTSRAKTTGKESSGKFGSFNFGSSEENMDLFTSRAEEESLYKYVVDSISKGLDKQKIMKTLYDKGWGKEQVDYIIKRARK